MKSLSKAEKDWCKKTLDEISDYIPSTYVETILRRGNIEDTEPNRIKIRNVRAQNSFDVKITKVFKEVADEAKAQLPQQS